MLADGVTPYALNSPRFSDDAHKLRTVWIPEGADAAAYDAEASFDFPVGTVVDQWQALGLLSGAPAAAEIPAAAVWDNDAVPLESRARAYLDVNCAHCHNPVGAADTSGLFLNQTTEIGMSFGVCKAPVAAVSGTGGRPVDIYPGKPEKSILIYRMETTDPAAMMPELGRSLTHTDGVDLINEWIESLPGSC